LKGKLFVGLGSAADKVSSRSELLTQLNVSGSGAPTHTPELATQTYVDIDTGNVYEWWAGVWH
jgi:hypothetical protein